jgi:hypothetical protein
MSSLPEVGPWNILKIAILNNTNGEELLVDKKAKITA